MKNVRLYLYGTVGCHLCELAKELLFEINNDMMPAHKFSWAEIDIIESDELMEQYGTSIPVFKIESSTQIYEINWHFNKEDIIYLLNQINQDLTP